MIASRQPTVADEPPPRGAAAADHAAPPGLAPAAGPAPADPADRTLDLSREDMAEALAQALNAAAASRLAGHADAAEVAQATQDEAGPRGPELQQPAAIGGAEVMHEADEALPMLAKRVQPMTAEDGTQLAPRIEVESTFMPSTGAGFTSSELREAGETLIRFPATAVHVATDIGADIAGDDGLPSGPTSIGIQPAFVRQAERAARWRRAPVRALLSVLLLTGITASALQLAYLYRAEAVAWQPRIKPVLDTVCATLGCSVEPLHRIQDVSIDSHSLAKADKGYELQVLLKNRAALASAFPDIELTLTDLTDMPIARRVVLPADYLARNTDAAAGIPARGEYKAVLRFDTQNLPINGYRLIVFYP